MTSTLFGENEGRIITAEEFNKLLKKVGCDHMVAINGTPAFPYLHHILDEHCSE